MHDYGVSIVHFTAGEAYSKSDLLLLMQAAALPPHAVVVQPELQSILIASSSPEAAAGSAAGPPAPAPRAGILRCIILILLTQPEY